VISILITGFGPFPGAPFNPTTPLVHDLARLRRPGLSDVRLAGHVFATSYAAVDRELPRLLRQHRPDALLMFGLAMRRRQLSIELRARNALALLPDASRSVVARRVIAREAVSERRMPMPAQRLLQAARGAHAPAMLSRDAGRYLCNYLCWRAAEAGPRFAAFVHVPPVPRTPRPRRARRTLDGGDLARAGEAILLALAAELRRWSI
jgi:pyroglutamyl-peptidase